MSVLIQPNSFVCRNVTLQSKGNTPGDQTSILSHATMDMSRISRNFGFVFYRVRTTTLYIYRRTVIKIGVWVVLNFFSLQSKLNTVQFSMFTDTSVPRSNWTEFSPNRRDPKPRVRITLSTIRKKLWIIARRVFEQCTRLANHILPNFTGVLKLFRYLSKMREGSKNKNVISNPHVGVHCSLLHLFYFERQN